MSTVGAGKLIEGLKNRVASADYSIWLSDLRWVDLKDNILTLATSGEFKRQAIEKKFLTIISTYFRTEIQGLNKVVLVCEADDSVKKTENSTNSNKIQENSQNSAEIDSGTFEGSRTDLNFSSYLKADFNRLAVSVIEKSLEIPGKTSPIYLFGSVGCGKTHLLQAAGNAFRAKFPFMKVRYVTPHEFVSEFTRAIAAKTDHEFRIRYRSLDVLLIDDVQFFCGKNATSVEFFHLFNEVYAPGKQIIFTSDRMPDELGDLDERLKSRLVCSAVVEIEKPAEADAVKLLKHLSLRYALELDDEVLAELAPRMQGDVRRMVGVINTLVSWRDLHEEKIDIEFCRKHLKQIFRVREEDFSAEKILAAVAAVANLPAKEIRSGRRTRNLSFYRQLLMYLLKKHTRMSFPEIASFIGGKSQATIHYGCAEIEKLIKAGDPRVEMILNKVAAAI